MLAHDRTAAAAPQDAAVLAKALGRAAEALGLSGATLAAVIGASEATVSRLVRGERALAPASKSGELALLVVRLYRSLDTLVGHDAAARLAWMRSRNDALHGVPAELIRSAAGLVTVVAYLDGMRAPI